MNEARKLPEGFVYLADIDASILQSVRYATSNNFLGRPVAGYAAEKIILTREAAEKLSQVQTELVKNTSGKFSLLVYDGYRPQTAVDDFVAWSEDYTDVKMKEEYYPGIPSKDLLFEMGYIAKRSGHSRGSTMDLTIVEWVLDDSGVKSYKFMDMGSSFDMFDPMSHYNCPTISEACLANRIVLRNAMVQQEFIPYDEEWWHFTLQNEPFPDTYYSFPVA
jgi:zinc D-Ala-D-Ala dipeptidase